MKVRVSNIQRFCLHDGNGIRTVIFLKGCNLKCPWCANPENIDYKLTKYVDKKTNQKRIVGYDIEALDLYDEIIKDVKYYQMNNGGVTFSGGEPLLQIKELESLLQKLKLNKINIAIETNLQVNSDLVKIALKYVDQFIVDIKILDRQINSTILGGNLDLYIKNVELLHKNNKIDIFRIPLSYEYTMTEKNKELILSFLEKYHSNIVEIFKVHNFAKDKYQSIGRDFFEVDEVSDNDILELYNEMKKLNINVKIIKI